MKTTVGEPGPLPKEALEYFRKKKLSPELDLEEAWPEEHDLAFKVAGVAVEDLLAAISAAVDKALAEGLTYEQFSAQLDDVMVALGWKQDGDKAPHRLRIIYDTNMRVARAAGQWDRIQRTAEARPYLEYGLGPAEHHRPEHEAWAGTVLAISDPWWNTHAPPNGYGCKCRLRQLSAAEAERKGISAEAPAGDPDPGWDHNPGASRGS